ncbi:hypothetical protein [Aestuariicoccus sp. MJ-SS9]|uniref:hypothetical protein n=1 Tax=Aestuariicoccus sp. MJ-SS9 TaxID=3079855 RepID=UPI00290969D8|nr:hypothetical protein [Aestuariicoccus sp. MJ-SS9]MDU8910392.1 hypothetical protein [Aestuariicoccus sp. MJ-SS9]
MKLARTLMALAAAASVSACVDVPIGPDKSVDRNLIDRKDLSQLKAGVWIDPNGCDHWIIDDGVEGYLSARLDKYGKPVCSGSAPPTMVTGDFKGGSTSVIGDPL